MTKPLQIRELPGEVREALSARAEQEGRSLAQQATAELRRSLAVDSSRRKAAAQRLLEELAGSANLDELPPELAPEVLVRADRDR